MRESPFSMLGSGHVSCYLTRYSRIPVALRGNGTRTNSIRILSPGTNIRTWPFVLLNNSLISRHFFTTCDLQRQPAELRFVLIHTIHDLFTKPVNSEHSLLNIRHQRAGVTLETLKTYAQGRRNVMGLFSARG